MKNVKQHIAAAFGRERLNEKKFKKNFHPPILRLNVKWKHFTHDRNGSHKKLSQEGKFYIDIIGTHYITLTNINFEISAWKPKGEIHFVEGSEEPEGVMSNYIDIGVEAIANEIIKETITSDAGGADEGLQMIRRKNDENRMVWDFYDDCPSNCDGDFKMSTTETTVFYVNTDIIEYEPEQSNIIEDENMPNPQ